MVITAAFDIVSVFQAGEKKEEGERKRKTNVSLVDTVSHGHL